MSKTIFRKVGGRIIPIKIDKVIEWNAHNKKAAEITLSIMADGEKVGQVWGQQSWKKKSRWLVGAGIDKEFRKKGLGKLSYNKLAAQIRKLGGKTLFGSTDNVSTIKSVRESIGYTRGYVGKGKYSGTTFVTSLTRKAKGIKK